MADTKPTLPPKQANALKRLAGKYNTRTAEADQLRSELDALVLEARNTPGGTFRAIADLADRSVAWVQGSLERSKNRT
jgi:hypothetical protein